jgi:hypothetical protein
VAERRQRNVRKNAAAWRLLGERLDAPRVADELHHDRRAAEEQQYVEDAGAPAAELEQGGDRPRAGEGPPNTSAPIKMAALTTVSTFSQLTRRLFGAGVVVASIRPLST